MGERSTSSDEFRRVELASARLSAPKVGDLLAAGLRRQIVTGELAEGAMLPPESELIRIYAVSRATLREALRVLEAEGLIEVRRGAHGGACVQRPQRRVASRYAGLVLQAAGTTLEDLYKAQMIIEPPAVYEVALSATPDQIDRLKVLCDQTEEKLDGSHDRTIDHFKNFHSELVAMSGLQTITLFAAVIEQIIHDAAGPMLEAIADHAAMSQAKAHASHRELVRLLESGDPQAAADHWRAHLEDMALASPASSTVVDLLSPDYGTMWSSRRPGAG